MWLLQLLLTKISDVVYEIKPVGSNGPTVAVHEQRLIPCAQEHNMKNRMPQNLRVGDEGDELAQEVGPPRELWEVPYIPIQPQVPEAEIQDLPIRPAEVEVDPNVEPRQDPGMDIPEEPGGGDNGGNLPEPMEPEPMEPGPSTPDPVEEPMDVPVSPSRVRDQVDSSDEEIPPLVPKKRGDKRKDVLSPDRKKEKKA